MALEDGSVGEPARIDVDDRCAAYEMFNGICESSDGVIDLRVKVR
jgi:hypothetical protein